MPSRSFWELTPKQSVEAECARRGPARVVDGCVELLGRRDADDALILALGGPPARSVLDTGPAPVHLYWLRVWGARGLLYAWGDSAGPAVVAALADEHWRVREMAAKVVARRLIGEAIDAVAGLTSDEVPRVRQAAQRAVTLLTAAGA
jgi:HEAT repeat protein